MATIQTSRSDVIWNYIGTIVSMASGFVLLPLLMAFLSDDELGLWYVFVAVASLATLFEFGFNPTFARNIVYVISGARELSASGHAQAGSTDDVDWHLLNVVVRTSKLVYAGISGVVAILLATIGTCYVLYITKGLLNTDIIISWIIFCISVLLNIYFLYSITMLRGYGDVAGENRAKTYARLSQLAVSAVLLVLGFGLVGASLGYLVNAALMRLFALVRLSRHKDIESARRADPVPVRFAEVSAAFFTVVHIAWRDGVVQLANYATTQATSIMASLYLGLAQTGTYSVLLQLGTAVYNFANAYPRSFFPSFQSAYADGDVQKMRSVVSKGIVAYWALFLFGAAGICLVILPLLPWIKPGVLIDYPLYFMICIYLSIWNHHSLFCNYIIGMNEIPYMKAFVISAGAGLALSFVFTSTLGWGAWGLVLGQLFAQLVYNAWKWPMYLCSRIGFSYRVALHDGIVTWAARFQRGHRGH